MKKKTRMLSAALSIALVAGAGCGRAGDEDGIRASGTVEVTEVRVTARAQGEIESLFYDEGDRVATGDTLAIIEHDVLSLQLEQARAAAEAAAAQLALLRSGARSQDQAQARAAVEQAQAQFEQAESDAVRFRALFERGSVTKRQLEEAETRLRIAQAGAASAREQLDKVQNLARPEELRAAEAGLVQAEAQVRLLERRIADALVVAPRNGVVVARPVEVGEYAAPGAVLFTLSDEGDAHLRIYVAEDVLGLIRIGQHADVYPDSRPEEAIAGRVVFVSPVAEFTPKNVQTREERTRLVHQVNISLPPTDGLLKAGTYADAVIPVGAEDE